LWLFNQALLVRDLQHPILGLVSYGLQNTCKEMVAVYIQEIYRRLPENTEKKNYKVLS